ATGVAVPYGPHREVFAKDPRRPGEVAHNATRWRGLDGRTRLSDSPTSRAESPRGDSQSPRPCARQRQARAASRIRFRASRSQGLGGLREEKAMASKLDQLRSMTTLVADTGDLGAVARLKPVDCTTNPTIVLKAVDTPDYQDVVDEALTWGRRQSGDVARVAAATADRLAISVGVELLRLVPGYVSTEVDSNLSFNIA